MGIVRCPLASRQRARLPLAPAPAPPCSLACPAQLAITQPLPEYRFEGLDCIAADGSRQSVVPLVRVLPEGGGDEPAAPAEGGDAPASGASGSSGGGGLPGWATALVVVGTAAAAAALALLVGPRAYAWWQDWRAARYHTYRDDRPSSDPAAAKQADAYAAKQSAVALSELGSKGQGGGAAAGQGTAAAAAPAPAAPGEQPFRIGTKVHFDDPSLLDV